MLCDLKRKKYPFRAEPKILDSMPNSGVFFRRSVGCPLLVSKYVLLDTISVDIILQMRRKQLSRYLLYLVFRGWRFFLRGFLLKYFIVCFGMQPTPLRNVSPPQSRDKNFLFGQLFVVLALRHWMIVDEGSDGHSMLCWLDLLSLPGFTSPW